MKKVKLEIYRAEVTTRSLDNARSAKNFYYAACDKDTVIKYLNSIYGEGWAFPDLKHAISREGSVSIHQADFSLDLSSFSKDDDKVIIEIGDLEKKVKVLPRSY